MQRYSITVCSPGTPAGGRPVLLVPFQPSAVVTAFIDELWKRVVRQKLPLAPNTHIATLHLDSETGGLIDYEDVLSDIVLDPKNEKLFAVFTQKQDDATPVSEDITMSMDSVTPSGTDETSMLSVRVVTPSTAKNKETCPVLRVPQSATLRQLHDQIAGHLQITPKFEEDAETYECNCKLANQLADGASPPDQFLVVHGKSVVERLQLPNANESSLKDALRQRFGTNFDTNKKVNLVGAEVHMRDPTMFKKSPAAAICSKQRHTPVHARTDIDETGQRRSKVLDLHTSELPVHPASMSATVQEAGLQSLSVNGVLDIFVVNRIAAGKISASVGKSSIFRSRAHWEPEVSQSHRGMAMFLSSLRVFTSLVHDMRDDDKSQDAVLHAFDLLTQFPPALRTLYILIQGKTPTAADSAAFSQAMFETLNTSMPTTVIGTNRSRLFEGARLFFGFVLEKARILKLPQSAETGALPYLGSFQTTDLRDHRTTEAVMRAVQTPNGLVERNLFDAFQDGGVLNGSHLQSYNMVKTDIDNAKARQALFSGGAAAETIAFSHSKLNSNYLYRDAGNASAAVDLSELAELGHLAELCGRNKLAVHKPSQLASAVAPCLTFDRDAHLAVYTGEQPCGDPGHSSLLFRPNHGEETIDSAVVDQLIAPILQGYESDGTAVFDALGGAAVRRQQRPDEILMFCVDCSASMRQDTDFEEVNEEAPTFSQDSDAQEVVEADFYNRASFDDMKERMCEYEGFDDMVAIIAGAEEWNRRGVTDYVVDILRTMLSAEIIKKAKDLESRRQYSTGRYWARREIPELQAALDKIKAFWAGLKTHEEAVCVFLIYRATATSQDISQRWTWSLGDSVPATAPHQISLLTADIVELPDHLRCPISHTLMEDAVTAADGHTYSHSAISHWFSIRRSSPMHGLELEDASLNANQEVCDAAALWIRGDGIPGRSDRDDAHPLKHLRTTNDINVTFDSRVGWFQRSIAPSMVLKDLYKLAFRGLKGRFVVFQLSTARYGPLAPTPEATVSTRQIRSGDYIHVRIAEDDPTSGAPASSTVANSGEACLVKVYERMDKMLFGFWVKKDTTQTLASVQWKYWRHRFQNSNHVYPTEKQVWTDLTHSGDGLMTGQPRKNTEKLATYLTTVHCNGHLGDEKVYQEDNTVSRMRSGQPMVLKVKLEGPWRRKERNKLTRLDVLKQMFEALINRMLAYNYRTHVGLITFATTPKVAMGISHVLENFRRSTGDMDAEGDTALWDGLALANDQLVEYGKKYPDAKKRIICISDGMDTKSTSNGSQEVCWRLSRAEIAVDSVCLGDESNVELRTLSSLLGCYRFHPTSLVNALAICEMEPFLSLTERPPISAPPGTPRHRLQFLGHFWRARLDALPTLVTNDIVPPRKEHPNLRDEFVQLKAITARPGNVSNSGNARSNLRISRLMTEMRLIVGNGTHPKYDIYVSETDMSFWKVVMDGPDESPYSAGTFLLYLHADDGYPTFAPKARFITKIKHPNVNAHGRICHSIFDRDWTSDISMTTLLDTVYGLLYQPEHSDPVNTAITLGFHHDQVEFAEEVREHVGRFARKSRGQWKRELLGENEDEEMGG